MNVKKSGFRHQALIYSDPEEFLATAVPFLRVGLEAGEPTLVAVRRENTALLEGELANNAAEVSFVEIETLGRNPARIIPFWRDVVEENGGGPIRGVGEPIWPGRGSAEVDECQRHESLLNVAFADPPAWSLLCPYDSRALDDEVLREVTHSHRSVVHDGVSEQSSGYVASRDCFAGGLENRPADATDFDFDRTGLGDVRHRVERGAEQAGLCTGDAAGIVVAANELAANSVAYGGGAGTMRMWRDADRFVVEFEDKGWIQEPLAGRLRPRPADACGRGLWLANQLCDLVQIRSRPHSTTVRLQTALS
jgi:anti-sigma regulatory factor (Ser/Thr protein kinase)